MENANKAPAAKGRETVPPDKYAADYIISYVTGIERINLARIKSGNSVIADTWINQGNTYSCPKIAHQDLPGSAAQWIRLGKYHSRVVYAKDMALKLLPEEERQQMLNGDFSNVIEEIAHDANL